MPYSVPEGTRATVTIITYGAEGCAGNAAYISEIDFSCSDGAVMAIRNRVPQDTGRPLVDPGSMPVQDSEGVLNEHICRHLQWEFMGLLDKFACGDLPEPLFRDLNSEVPPDVDPLAAPSAIQGHVLQGQ